MCLSTPKDNSAGIARESEAARQAKIDQGTASINQQFGGFDDSYFANLRQAALDFFNPDLDRQVFDTREGLVKNLARSGNLDGSVGIKTLADFEEEAARQRALVGDKARSFATDARGNVEQNRSRLLNQLSATADPAAAAASASAAAQSLSAPPQFSPLGDAFKNFTNIGAQQIQGAREGFDNPARRFAGIKPAAPFGQSSARYVR